MELKIINSRPEYRPVALIDPPPTGYLFLAAVVEPTAGRTPFPRGGSRKASLLSELKTRAAALQLHKDVDKITVYRAVLVPPAGSDARRLAGRPAAYDVVVLVEARTVDAISDVEASPQYDQLLQALTFAVGDLCLMRARCLKRVGDVDKTRQGLFLFNYFAADDPAVALQLWDYLAGWYARETGLDNSTLLGPLGPADYAFVNHARWDISLPRLAMKQFTSRTFRSYVTANLHANATAAMPILYRLA